MANSIPIIPQLMVSNTDISQQCQRVGINVGCPKLVRMQITSRHRSTKYPVFVLLDQNADGLDRVSEWWCKCNAGMRTVNPCGHIIAVLGIICSGIDCRTPALRLANIFEHELHDESEEE